MNFANVKEWTITEGDVLSVIDSQNRVLWQKVGPTPPGPDYSEPFYVENISNAAETLSIKKSDTSAPTLTIEYSTDKTTWQTLGTTSTTALTYTLQVGDKVYLRCDTNTGWGSNASGTYSNRINGCSKVGGNIMSLLYGSNFTGNETTFRDSTQLTFYNLFNSNTNLVNAQELLLPATTLRNYCYYCMFDGCTSLTTAPQLPATTLAISCYYSMFNGCTSLTTAPTLPATTLIDYCYCSMFKGCTALVTAPALQATTLATGCYYLMFCGCTALVTAPALQATTLIDYCYGSMFKGCTALVTAPALQATTLATGCYMSMFVNCTSLTTAPQLPATTLASLCYSSMFQRCTALTTAPQLPATTLASNCYLSMFHSCTALTTAPALQATTLATGCYSSMFQGCTSLNTVECLATDISAQSATSTWLYNVSATGTFTKAAGVTWPDGKNGIPSGWTVVEQ